mmetsp:Transcript_11515/g.24539  ORF Transcript_11515/g.24539 Transcript_11515/m.24539 type:complete len:795 (-) Transcript_11515:54-2438(-)
METAAQLPPPVLNSNELPLDEILANVLQILSSSTFTSPLICQYYWEEEGKDENASVSWDPFVSFAESILDVDSRVSTNSNNFLEKWLQHVTTHGIANNNEGVAKDVHALFLDNNRMNELLSNRDHKPDDDLLWLAGLELLKSTLFPEKDSNMDPIPPHELLLFLTDSYSFNDDDLVIGNLVAAEEENMSSKKLYRLPSSIAMFFLRTLLLSHALESAKESITESLKTFKPVRWRRMKSMVDDALSIFQRMVFDYSGKVVDGIDFNAWPEPLKYYPIEPGHIISIGTWLYTNHLFPACHDILSMLLRNHLDGSNPGTSGVKLLETCYETFSMLTALMALEVAVISQEHSAPSTCVQNIIARIEHQNTGDFFNLVTLAQGEIIGKVSVQIPEEKDEEVCCPWNDYGHGTSGRGLSLEEHLLLYPSIRKKNGGAFYDELGIAAIAYWRLKAQQTDLSPLGLDPLPSPYSGSYRWTLLFPHVITFLDGAQASLTMNTMDQKKVLSMSDGYLLGVNLATFSLGFDMIQLFTRMPVIRPIGSWTKTQNPNVRWAHSSEGLESTIATLLSHVMRVSYLEASAENGSPSVGNVALKYSSLELMKMTQTLLGVYKPATQIRTLSRVCQLIKTNDVRVLLPKALDFIRPIIMGMCKNIEKYNDDTIALDDMAIIQTTSGILEIFLSDVIGAFEDSKSPLPKDVDEFMTYIETYSSVFAIMRLQRMWISRCKNVVKDMEKRPAAFFQSVVKKMDETLGKLRYNSLETSLGRLIDFWERSEDPPMNWHRLFLMKLALQDALAKPEE